MKTIFKLFVLFVLVGILEDMEEIFELNDILAIERFRNPRTECIALKIGDFNYYIKKHQPTDMVDEFDLQKDTTYTRSIGQNCLARPI